MTLVAIEQAITFLGRTDLIATARQQPLPPGVTDVLKISSGDHDVLLAVQESFRHSQEDVRHAAEFYVQQILFSPDSDHYRVLGVDPDDAEAKIKLHYRLLVRWLHPDKNSNDWEVVFSERINRAWQALRTPERRRQYDEHISSAQTVSSELVVSREIKPAQWRENKTDTHFMSARTIKRLPIAVFSLLGIGAMFALWWFSQMQPHLQPHDSVANQAVQASAPESVLQPAKPLPVIIAPTNKIPPDADETESTLPESIIAGIEQKSNEPAVPVVSKPEITSSIAKTETPSAAMKVPASLPGKQKKPKPLPEAEVAVSTPALVLTIDDKTAGKRTKKNKATREAPVASAVIAPEEGQQVLNNVAVVKTSSAESQIADDESVKQFLQRFSRVYAEGDYFALHNLFTKDLSILGAPSQRSVLKSYRQLFENSQSREIALDHVTWLANDEHIVVIASYQAQVLPHGKAEAKLSRGDIRLDLRMENGQLRIIRLQSDTKNG